MSPLSHSDSNSLAAAASVAGSAPAQRERVFEEIETYGSLAAHEIAALLRLPGNSVRPRLIELEAAGRIEKHGKSKTPANRSCHLYRVKQKPVVLVQERAFDLPEMVVPNG